MNTSDKADIGTADDLASIQRRLAEVSDAVSQAMTPPETTTSEVTTSQATTQATSSGDPSIVAVGSDADRHGDATVDPNPINAPSIDASTIDAASIDASTINAATGQTAARGTVPRMIDVLVPECLSAAITSPHRRAAIESVVQCLHRSFGGPTVRYAAVRNDGRIKRLYDAAQGWMSSNSPIAKAAEADMRTDADSRTGDSPAVVRVALQSRRSGSSTRDTLIIATPTRRGGTRAPLGDRDRLDALSKSASAIGAAIDSRPRLRIPRPAAQLTRGVGAAIVLAVVVGTIVSLYPIAYRTPCAAVLTPSSPRIIAIPFDATLADAHVAPGDLVRAGDPLVSLDGRPIQLELESIRSEIRSVEKDRQIALAAGGVAEAQRATLIRDKLLHRRYLLDDRLSRLVIAAPIDGVLMGDDLRRMIGSPMQTGHAIGQIAALDEMTVELRIPEIDIEMVRDGDPASIRFPATLANAVDGVIHQIDPQAEVIEDDNVFIARVDVANPEGRLRPGMRGHATVYGPHRPVAYRVFRVIAERFLASIGY